MLCVGEGAVAHGVGRFWQYAGEVLDRIRADPDRPGWMPFSVLTTSPSV